MLVISPDLRIPLREFQFTFARSSGPGGQNVNKVSSKATLRWAGRCRAPASPSRCGSGCWSSWRSRVTAAGDLLVTSQRFRDAGRNVADCLEKLRALVAAAAQPPRRRRPTRPTHGSVQRRLASKRRRSQAKQRRRPGDPGEG